jgi:hypothetical protein
MECQVALLAVGESESFDFLFSANFAPLTRCRSLSAEHLPPPQLAKVKKTAYGCFFLLTSSK